MMTLQAGPGMMIILQAGPGMMILRAGPEGRRAWGANNNKENLWFTVNLGREVLTAGRK